ncbi:MAG: ABC transporter substrate-binding protein [Candidatus Binatia bacterium]
MKHPLTLGLLLISLLVPFLLQAASEQPRRGGTLNFAISKDLVLMNPLVGTGSTERRIRELIFEPLLGIDLKGNIHPNLAASWEVSKDGKLYTFKLRRGVKFHNGREMKTLRSCTSVLCRDSLRRATTSRVLPGAAPISFGGGAAA